MTREKKNNNLVDDAENFSEPGKQLDNHQDSTTAFLRKTILELKFVSKNAINLSKKKSQSEISMLSKGLKFVPSASKIDQGKLKRELEEYGRKFHLIWDFRNDEEFLSNDKFRLKSSFNLRNKMLLLKLNLAAWRRDGWT